MATCEQCGYENRSKAKICGQCGTPIMSAGVGYAGAEPAGPIGPPGGGNMLPTIPEGAETSWPKHGVSPGEAKVGGAAATVQEDPAVLPQPKLGAAPRTQLSEEVTKPLAGWLVVLRSRSMSPYQDIPIYIGRNMLGRDPNRGPHNVDDTNASKEHAVAIGNKDGVDLMDLGSANGTVVNNQQIRTHTLQKGDMVKIGKTTMVFIPFTESKIGAVAAF